MDLNPGFPRGYLFKWFALGADPKKEKKTNKQKNPKEVHNFSLILSVNISDEYEAREPETLSEASFVSERHIFDTSINQWVPLICILCYKKLSFFLIFLLFLFFSGN